MASDPAAEHIVKSFEVELNRLRGMLTQMGGMVESQVAMACEAVLSRDDAAAAGTVEADPKVDALEREVEQFVIRVLALRQPFAQDLRLVVASLKITGDLERIGDYAANVAKRSLVLNQFNLPFSLTGLANMARLVQVNLKLVIDAVGENDTDKAMEVWRSDEGVDEIYNALFRELVTYMMEDPRNITPCTHLLFIAKNLERIGDHATNVAETVYYAVKGETLTGGRPKGDTSAYALVRPPRE
jgi:phosphate transport system protein